MNGNDVIDRADIDSLKVVKYPDSILRAQCVAIEDSTDLAVSLLVDRMFEIMFAANGIGLAAPQVGIDVRLFIASPEFDASDRQVFINPTLSDCTGKQEDEEGCLSFPGIYCKVKRYRAASVQAIGLDGKMFTVQAEDFSARVYQHEIDHLNGRLLIDHMSTVAKFANRQAIRQLEDDFL